MIAENEYSLDEEEQQNTSLNSSKVQSSSDISFRKQVHKERLRKSLMESTRRKQIDPLNSSTIHSFERESDKHTPVM